MSAVRLAVSVAVLIGTLVLLQFRSTGEAVPIRKALDSFTASVGPWQGREWTIFDDQTLSLLRAKDYLMRRYVGPDGKTLWLYVAYWDTQRKGAQIHSPKNCLPGAGWEPLEASLVTIALPPPRGSIVVNRYLIQKDAAQQLVLYWYQSQGRTIAGEIAARVEMVKSSILRNRTDGALVRVSAFVDGTVPQTEATLVRYVQALYPMLGEHLPD